VAPARPKKAAVAPVPAPVGDGTERLKRVKLILEIGVVIVSLASGIVALFWGSR
jgi:hypothetical protein